MAKGVSARFALPKYNNIKLDYRVRILLPNDQVLYADGCEVFMDEHLIQWVKFVPKNGYVAGHETMVRTDQIAIVKHAPEQNSGSN